MRICAGIVSQGGRVLLFTRIPNTTLYRGAPQDASSGHQGEVLLILPAQTPVPPGSMTLDEAWEFQHPTYGAGYLLFVGPDSGFSALNDSQAGSFANRVHELLPRVVSNHHLSLAWVTGQASNPASLRLQTLSIVRAGDVTRSQNLPQVIRFQQIEVMFLPGVPVTLGSTGLVFENTEYLAPPGSDPSIELPTRYRVYMRSAAPRDIDSVGETIEVPLTGANRGSLSFDLNDLIADEIDAGVIDAAIYYVAPDQERGRDQSLRYPLFNLYDSMTGDETVSFRAVLFAAHQMNSRFEFLRNGTPRLRSNFGTYDGHPIYFIPSDGSALVFTHVPNPGVHPSRAAEVETHYALIPTGYFELAVDPVGDTGDMVWLRGGSSGNEFVSFQPRRGSTPGDVIAFFPGQFGYGPDRVSLARSIQQDPSPGNGELLTGLYRTSWATVSPHPNSPNGHINQYYAQPDDNVLHEFNPSNTRFLSSVEIAASDLMPLTGNGNDALLSFPIAPLNAVIAPDPRVAAEFGMSKYVVFEKQIMSPTRKKRITANAPGPRATPIRRRLLQNPGTTPKATPQGMIVDTLDTDWQRMTLAFDGTNHLRFSNISDDLQIALNTNELFMVVALPNKVEQTPVTDPENLIEITGWPFRLEIGQTPLGLPAGDDLHRHNNVLIFKFKQGKLIDLVDDTAQWASAEEFNGDDDALDDVQEWLGEFFEDAQEKAEDGESAELYSSLVEDVLTDPDWVGVLALNVTVPLDEMPCEVQGLLGGMRNFSAFKAHHIGFPVAKVTTDTTTGAMTMEQSSIFGLIDYEDDGGLSTPRVDYEYYVNTLKVRFANTEIADFSSTVELGIKKAFDEPIRDAFTDPGSGKVTIDSVELEGSYQTLNGTPSYTFEVIAEHDPFEFLVVNDRFPILKDMTITKVQFNTTACVDPAKLVADPDLKVSSEFVFWGSLGFRANATFDIFSFDKLPFSDLKLHMAFGFGADGIPVLPTTSDFRFDPGNLRFELSGSTPREDSLFSNFPIRLTNFHYAPQKVDITELGYWHIPNMIPGWGEADRPQYALAMTIDIGPLTGAYAKKRVNLAIEIIAAWAPAERGTGATFGLKLGQSSDGNREFSIEGVFAIGVENFGFLKIPENAGTGDPFMYAFFIKSAYIKIMKKQLPPGGTFTFLLFVPYANSNQVNLEAIGGFAAYKRESSGGGSSDTQFGVKVNTPVLEPAATGGAYNVDQTITIKVKVENVSSTATGPFEVVVRIEAKSDDTFPRLPAPSYHRFDMDHAQGSEKNIEATWKASVPGEYEIIAKVEVVGGMSPGDMRATREIEVGYGAYKEKKTTPLRVDYLGVGWRVGMPPDNLQLLQINTIGDVFEALEEQMLPDKSGTALKDHLANVYKPDYGLTVGVDITIMSVVRFAFLFAQPNNLYGALLGFVDKAPAFLKGFQFQILYKKLSDDLGVYQMQLKLPDKIRQFELGAASITIPVIGIDIYTNGDFKLDFGFPHGGDWSRSFSIAMMAGPVPILGYVGFYFNKLSGATSTRVPAFTEESGYSWNPVLEFGFGIKVGIGKTVNKGPLRAGASIAILAILEGALAWRKLPPALESTSTVSTLGNAPDWYWVKGQAGLAAELYGIIDFGIVKIGIEVSASAVFTFVFESYKDSKLGISLSVSVRVSIVIGSFKIFGKRVNISISFSFSATFNFSFTVKNTQPLPDWNQHLAEPIVRTGYELRALQQATPTPIAWNVAFKTTPDANGPMALTFAPQVTQAGPAGSRETYAVAGLTLTSGDTGQFNRLARAITAWTLARHKGQTAFDGTATVTLEDLEDLNQRLNVPRTLATGTNPLDYSAIMAFLAANYTAINVTATALEPDPDDPQATTMSVAFPMTPEAQLATVGQAGGEVTRDFGAFNMRDNGFEEDLADYFGQLAVDVEYKSGIFTTANRVLDQAGNASMATHVFQDYFAFLVKAGVDRAIEHAQTQTETNPAWSSSLNDLLNAIGGQFSVVGQLATRTFFGGLRLPPLFNNPDLVALSNTAVPLYELTGQQFPLRLGAMVTVEPEDEEDDPVSHLPAWSMTLTRRTGGSTFVNFTGVLMDIPQLGGITDPDDFDLDENRENIAGVAGATPFLGTITGPTRIDPVRHRPRHYSFANPTHLDHFGPNDANGSQTFIRQATTYPLPQALLERLSEGATSASDLSNVGGSAVPVGSYQWALRIDFSAKQVERPVEPADDADETALETAQYIPNTYMIGGTNEVTRDLIDRLLAATTPGITGLKLYYEVESKTNGLVGDSLGASPDVLIMKTNLSTVSAPQTGLQQVTHPAADDYSAAMTTAQATSFLRLLWEASIVNSPGYYLYYDNGSTGEDAVTGLPDEAFQGRTNFAPMTLLVMLDGLKTYANTLVINSATFEEGNLYLQTGDNLWLPSIAPGAIGFELSRPNPETHTANLINADLGTKYNLLSYNIVDNANFNQSMRGLPVGPASDPDSATSPWVYRQGIRVFPFSKDAPASGPVNLYTGTGKALTINFEFLDIFGNLLPMAQPLQLTGAVVKYTDSIIGVGQWPGVASGYEFSGTGGTGTLNVTLAFATGSYPAGAGHAAQSLTTFYAAREQLEGPGVTATLRTSVAPSMSQDVKSGLVAFINSVIAYLESIPATTPAPITATLTLGSIIEANRNVASHTFEVETSIVIQRDADLVEDVTRLPDARTNSTLVPPEPITNTEPLPEQEGNYQDGQKVALENFARAFETAFPELKAATGNGKSGPRTIWAVRLSFANGPGLRANVNDDPAFFAPAPLSTTLENREDIPMKLGPATVDPTPVTVSGVDMDVLGREFLGEVDKVLGPMIAPAARKVNAAAYLKLMQSKEKLATAIASGVTNVLQQDDGNTYAQVAAREAWRQSILTNLSAAYDIETAVVYPVATTNNSSLARLYGSVAARAVAQPSPYDEFGFSPAKVDISGSASHLAFLVDADRARDQASIFVNVDYAVSHVEHDIDDAVGGYEASSWLNFIIQDKRITLGEVDIPIALREFPTPPALIDQLAIPVDIDTVSTLADATEWEYFYTFHQSVVAQDSVFANVVFNVGPNGLRNLLQNGEDLLDCLARFHYEYPFISGDINSLAQGYRAVSGQASALSAVLGRFADLVEDVADTWGDWIINGTSRRLDQTALERYEWDFGYIEQRLNATTVGVEVTKRSATPGPEQRFPRLEVTLEDGSLFTPARTVNGNSAIYEFPWTGPLPETRQRTLSWDDLDVLHTENAWGGIRLSRNVSLSKLGHHRPTNERFIYETQQVRFVNKVTPLIDNKRPIDITGGDPTVRALNQHLSNLLRELFEPALGQANPNPRLIKIGVRYAYDVRGQGGAAVGPAQVPEDPGFYEFQAFLPVTQVLPFNLLPTVPDLDAFAGNLASTMTSWLASVNPSRSRAFFELDLAIFAALSATDLPVLRLRRLWLDLDKIG